MKVRSHPQVKQSRDQRPKSRPRPIVLPGRTMQACAVCMTKKDKPGKRRELKIIEVRAPDPNDLKPNEILVKSVASGACATNREIFLSQYGHPPRPEHVFTDPTGKRLKKWLATGHESLFMVIAVGSLVDDLVPGDLVVATVRPGCEVCPNCLSGHANKCLSGIDTLVEMGIHAEHGTDVEYKVFKRSRLVRVPDSLGVTGVLAEPFSISAHVIEEALATWRLRNPGYQDKLPAQCLITGAGPIGISAALMCRLMGIQTVALGRTPAPTLKSKLITDLGALYVSTQEAGRKGKPLPVDEVGNYLRDQNADFAPGRTGYDLIIEATGDPEAIHRAAHLLADGGVMVLTSITGKDKKIWVRMAKINFDWVLGNKSMVGVVNAHPRHFAQALEALERSESLCTGWRDQILTHRKENMAGCLEMVDLLMSEDSSVLKAYSVIDPACF